LTEEPDTRPDNPDPADFILLPDGIHWECQHCGDCCGNVYSRHWVDPGLRKHIGEPVDNYCKRWNRKSGRCGDYENRSNVCRGYPFSLRKEEGRYYLQMHKRCRGFGKGPEVDRRKIAEMMVDLCRREFGIEFEIDWSHLAEGFIELKRKDE